MIAASAVIAGYESIRRLVNPAEVDNLGWVAVAGLLGFIGNEAVAQYRIRIGERIGSAALIADGYHARTDGFASIAFAASLGIGVMAAAIPLALYQGLLTLLGFALGNFLPAGQVDAVGATGGVILLGLGFRLAGIKQIPVGDLLPALVVAPLLTALVGTFA